MNLIEEIQQKFIAHSDEKLKAKNQYFFKESVNFYGVSNSYLHEIAVQYRSQVKALGKTEGFKICEALFKVPFYETQILACNWSDLFHAELKPEDDAAFTRWVNTYVTNWAVCDTLCNHTVGEFLMKFPEQIKVLKQWATSTNRWTKRAAGVSLIIPARKGLFLKDIFEIADTLLLDKDDMVQKGYGWMLKAASEAHQQEVFDYVVQHKSNMPRTALRYAIEKMPVDLKKQAMVK